MSVAVQACETPGGMSEDIIENAVLLVTKMSQGRELGLYKTGMGRFWIPNPGRELLAWLVWEIRDQQDYESRNVTLRKGDTVIDCGAHVGVFTRYALDRGVARVVAIEPEPANLACLELNFAAEMAAGKVVVVRKGVWDSKTELEMSVHHNNSAAPSFVTQYAGAEVSLLPVMPLDDIVTSLGLERVDFIKMDIEGAEQRAVKGALDTIRRFKPRMAICTYHGTGDSAAVTRLVSTAYPRYRIHANEVVFRAAEFRYKVLFFE